jgi:dihydroorotase-like cyclic amidohydrolase
MDQQSMGMLITALRRRPSLALRIRPRHVATVKEAASRTLVQMRTRWTVKRAEQKSDRVFSEILADPSFYRKLDASARR